MKVVKVFWAVEIQYTILFKNMTKTETVKEHVSAKEYKAALKIAKTFRIGLTREEQRALQHAYECMVYPNCYG